MPEQIVLQTTIFPDYNEPGRFEIGFDIDGHWTRVRRGNDIDAVVARAWPAPDYVVEEVKGYPIAGARVFLIAKEDNEPFIMAYRMGLSTEAAWWDQLDVSASIAAYAAKKEAESCQSK